MKLIDNAGILWHRLWSVRLSVLTTLYTSAAGAWLVLPVDWKPVLSHVEQMILAGVGMLLPALSSIAPVIKQPKVDEIKAGLAMVPPGASSVVLPDGTVRAADPGNNSEHA
jgi:hypothetical protein